MVTTRGDVHLVRLDPTLGSEIKKTRPCVVISPDELNAHLRTAIVDPSGRVFAILDNNTWTAEDLVRGLKEALAAP